MPFSLACRIVKNSFGRCGVHVLVVEPALANLPLLTHMHVLPMCSEEWGDQGFARVEMTGLDGRPSYGTCFM